LEVAVTVVGGKIEGSVGGMKGKPRKFCALLNFAMQSSL
jgi:hypothetical protein